MISDQQLLLAKSLIEDIFVNILKSDSFKWTDEITFFGVDDSCNFEGVIERHQTPSCLSNTILLYGADDETVKELTTLGDLTIALLGH